MTGKCVAILSGKGGVGKTTIAAAWGEALAMAGKCTLLIDLNIGMRDADLALGMESRVVFDWSDVLSDTSDLGTAIVTREESGLSMLAAPLFSDSDDSAEKRLEKLIEKLKKRYDWIILDGASGPDSARLCNAADEFILVARPDDSGLRAADRMAGILREKGKTPAGVVLNFMCEDALKQQLQYSETVCAQVLDLNVLGAVPDADDMRYAVARKKPLTGESVAAKAIAQAWKRFEEPELPLKMLFDVDLLKKPSVLQRLFRKKDISL